MTDYKVVEKKDHHAVHCLTWSADRAQSWIDKYGDSKTFVDTSLNKDSFTIIDPNGHEVILKEQQEAPPKPS